MPATLTQTAVAFAESNGLLYFETSAKTGLGITQLFTDIGSRVHAIQ